MYDDRSTTLTSTERAATRAIHRKERSAKTTNDARPAGPIEDRWIDGPMEQPWFRFTLQETCAAADRRCRDHVAAAWIHRGLALVDLHGQRETMGPGCLIFLRPGDVVAIHSADVCKPAQVASLSLPIDEEQRLESAYRNDLPHWPWRPHGPAHRVQMTPAVQDELTDAAMATARPGQRRLDVAWITAQLLRLSAPAPTGPGTRATPGWLAEAIHAMDGGPLVAGGVPTLVHLSNRSADHVARSCRRHLGCTPTELVNRLRVERAARLIRLHGEDIAEAATAVGLPNLGHFYRLFKRRYGTSPRRFVSA